MISLRSIVFALVLAICFAPNIFIALVPDTSKRNVGIAKDGGDGKAMADGWRQNRGPRWLTAALEDEETKA